MHICFVCNEYPPARHGGVGTFTQTLGRVLVERGHQVTVVGSHAGRNRIVEDDRGVRVIRFPCPVIRGVGAVIGGYRLRRELRRLHWSNPVDVVEGPELSFSMLPKSFPAEKIIRMHGGHHFFRFALGNKPARLRGFLERRSFKVADHLCAVSHYVAASTRDLLGLGSRPIEIIPNPIDTKNFIPRYGTKEDPGLIIFIGTVCEKKGVRQLVQAMPRIIQRVPHARLWIVGPDWRDPETGGFYVATLADDIPPSLEDRIEIRGPVRNEQLPDLMARAQVLVYPSHMEAMPLAWLEGLAMGKAVVASWTGPGPEVIEDGVSGLLCDPHDPVSIAQKVVEALASSDLRSSLGESARRRAEQRFSIEALVVQNEKFYARCPEHEGKGSQSS